MMEGTVLTVVETTVQGGVDNRPCCGPCKAKAERKRTNNSRLAVATFLTALGGCQYATASTFVELNVVASWIHFFPGIGSAVVEGIATLGAVAVDITCMSLAVIAYNAADATLQNNYYKDIRDCEAAYSDCQ